MPDTTEREIQHRFNRVGVKLETLASSERMTSSELELSSSQEGDAISGSEPSSAPETDEKF